LHDTSLYYKEKLPQTNEEPFVLPVDLEFIEPCGRVKWTIEEKVTHMKTHKSLIPIKILSSFAGMHRLQSAKLEILKVEKEKPETHSWLSPTVFNDTEKTGQLVNGEIYSKEHKNSSVLRVVYLDPTGLEDGLYKLDILSNCENPEELRHSDYFQFSIDNTPPQLLSEFPVYSINEPMVFRFNEPISCYSGFHATLNTSTYYYEWEKESIMCRKNVIIITSSADINHVELNRKNVTLMLCLVPDLAMNHGGCLNGSSYFERPVLVEEVTVDFIMKSSSDGHFLTRGKRVQGSEQPAQQEDKGLLLLQEEFRQLIPREDMSRVDLTFQESEGLSGRPVVIIVSRGDTMEQDALHIVYKVSQRLRKMSRLEKAQYFWLPKLKPTFPLKATKEGVPPPVKSPPPSEKEEPYIIVTGVVVMAALLLVAGAICFAGKRTQHNYLVSKRHKAVEGLAKEPQEGGSGQ
jgi:ribosomal protein L35AE/L33A